MGVWSRWTGGGRLLVSFCNLPAPLVDTACPGLGILEIPSGRFRWLETGAEGVGTCTGLAVDAGRIYTAWGRNRWEYHLTVLDARSLRVLGATPLGGVEDAHGIATDGRRVYVTSTGTDRVFRFPMDGDRLAPHGEVAFAAGVEETDAHHLNSIQCLPDAPGTVLSAFGPKDGDTWSSARQGRILLLRGPRTAPETLAEGLRHPHSVSFSPDGDLFFCESGKGVFRNRDGSFAIRLNGYTRGVAWLGPSVAAVGTTTGRRISRSTGRPLVGNPAEQGEALGETAVWLVDVSARRVIGHFPLEAAAPEIFDLALL